MKLVIQRVKKASVTIEGRVTGKIDEGLLVLIGITHEDTKEKAEHLAKKVGDLRIFNDKEGKMNLSVKDVNGKILVVSQFTLYGDARKGNRPSFSDAARPEKAIELYEYFMEKCKESGLETQSGEFGADMKVELLNDGPVTIIMEK